MLEAERFLRTAISLRPDFADAHSNLGALLEKQDRMDEAMACYREALHVKPDHANARYNLGHVLKALGRFSEAIDCYHQTLAIEPKHANCHYSLATIELSLGHFAQGWNHYRYRPAMRGHNAPAIPPCLPAALAGQSVSLLSEQGLGDEMFFLRFIPRLQERGAGPITYYRAGRKLVPLLTRAHVMDHIAKPHDSPEPNDGAIPIGELPRLLEMERIEQIPPVLMLAPMPASVEAMRARLHVLGPPPYIGVTWRAGTPDEELALYKACPLSRLAVALGNVTATVLVLQRHPAPGEIEAFTQALGRPVHDLSSLNKDLEQMLALLAQIDDYIGVSNTNMHLRAGAGKTAKVLVPAPPEWRWMAEGRESPWFPGFTVYRQGYDGNWEEAFDMLGADLNHVYGR